MTISEFIANTLPNVGDVHDFNTNDPEQMLNFMDLLCEYNPRVMQIICEFKALTEHISKGNKLFNQITINDE